MTGVQTCALPILTQNKDCFKHTSVQLPVLEIADDSSVALRALDMSTHLDMLKFYATAKKQIVFGKMKSVQKGSKKLAAGQG